MPRPSSVLRAPPKPAQGHDGSKLARCSARVSFEVAARTRPDLMVDKPVATNAGKEDSRPVADDRICRAVLPIGCTTDAVPKESFNATDSRLRALEISVEQWSSHALVLHQGLADLSERYSAWEQQTSNLMLDASAEVRGHVFESDPEPSPKKIDNLVDALEMLQRDSGDFLLRLEAHEQQWRASQHATNVFGGSPQSAQLSRQHLAGFRPHRGAPPGGCCANFEMPDALPDFQKQICNAFIADVKLQLEAAIQAAKSELTHEVKADASLCGPGDRGSQGGWREPKEQAPQRPGSSAAAAEPARPQVPRRGAKAAAGALDGAGGPLRSPGGDPAGGRQEEEDSRGGFGAAPWALNLSEAQCKTLAERLMGCAGGPFAQRFDTICGELALVKSAVSDVRSVTENNSQETKILSSRLEMLEEAMTATLRMQRNICHVALLQGP